MELCKKEIGEKMAIGFILKGKQHDIVVLADSLEEAKKELKKHQKDINQNTEETLTPKKSSTARKTSKVSITKLILELKDEGFFKQPQSSSAIRKKLASRGHHYAATSLTWPLQQLTRKHELGRVPEGRGWKYAQR